MSDISPRAEDFIIAEEVGDRRMYERSERFPTWPGGASGVTIGDGYDCGYVTHDELDADWKGRISDAMLAALHSVVGIKGAAAAAAARSLRGVVDIPWDVATAVFKQNDVPKFVGRCRATLPNFDKLPPDCRGAIVSLAFNRGTSWAIPIAKDPNQRFLEMREIKQAMIAERFDRIPAALRHMKRIWPPGTSGHEDLTRRREREAVLFEQGLKACAIVIPAQNAPGREGGASQVPASVPLPTAPTPAAIKQIGAPDLLAAFATALLRAIEHRLAAHPI